MKDQTLDWNDANEITPDVDASVLAVSGKTMSVAAWDGLEGWYHCESGALMSPVTHWMLLPPLPGAAEEREIAEQAAAEAAEENDWDVAWANKT